MWDSTDHAQLAWIDCDVNHIVLDASRRDLNMCVCQLGSVGESRSVHVCEKRSMTKRSISEKAKGINHRFLCMLSKADLRTERDLYVLTECHL